MALTATCCRIALHQRSDSENHSLEEDREMKTLEFDTEKTAQTFADDAAVTVPVTPSKIVIIKKKPSAVAQVAARTGDDPLADRVHEIESFDKETAISRVFECEDKVAETYFELGGALARIRDNRWFDPYPTFDKWVEDKTEMKRSKALALIQIYLTLANSGLPWSKVSHIGWTKLRRIARVLTKENIDHWIDVASEHSRMQLVEIVREYVANHSYEHPKMETPTHKKTFAFYPDQYANVETALEKAMKEAHTDVPSEALSLICIDYMGGSSLADRLKCYSLEAVLMALNEAFPQFVKDTVVSDDDDNANANDEAV